MHVEDRHAFLDGHYFYQLKSEYATEATDSKPAEEKSGWFNSKRSMASVSSEKSLGRFKGSRNQSVQSFGDFLSLSRVTSRSSNDQKEEEINPITVEISKSVRVDLDPSKKSYRPETVLIHHDRIHNPGSVSICDSNGPTPPPSSLRTTFLVSLELVSDTDSSWSSCPFSKCLLFSNTTPLLQRSLWTCLLWTS